MPWPSSACYWPTDKRIPEGWEEIELESRPLVRGRHFSDPCACGDDRLVHAEHRGRCLEAGCECEKFEEPKGGSQKNP